MVQSHLGTEKKRGGGIGKSGSLILRIGISGVMETGLGINLILNMSQRG